jgi:hypothetical protein
MNGLLISPDNFANDSFEGSSDNCASAKMGQVGWHKELRSLFGAVQLTAKISSDKFAARGHFGALQFS